MPKGSMNASFEIHGESLPEFLVIGLDGEEEISRPYRFEIDLTCTDPTVDLAAMVHCRATLTLEFKYRRKVHGIISTFEMHGRTASRTYHYRAVLVPMMAKLALSKQTQIYGRAGEATLFDIILAELIGEAPRGVDGAARVEPEYVDLERLPQTEYPTRDYIVQYQESNLNFVQRLLEHHGIFYFFSHDDALEKICFGDNNAAFDDLTDGDGHPSHRKELEYRPPSDDGGGGEGQTSVHSLIRRRNSIPNRVVLREHNYRELPGLLHQPDYLHADEDVDPQGHGAIVLDGEHFATTEEGERLAKVRAEELMCEQELFIGTSDSYRFCPGFIFDLTGHSSEAFNRDHADKGLLITRVRHRAGERLPDDGPAYVNEFTAIPAKTPFRPRRRTPVPRVSGLFYAHIDGISEGKRADIDEKGRYKIRIPFDMNNSDAGMASRYVRMAQPYSGFASDDGENSGMHFPILKGTEVIVACINGDPNRPIIIGTVPNARSPSVVTGAENTKNRIRTTSGIVMEFEDGSG